MPVLGYFLVLGFVRCLIVVCDWFTQAYYNNRQTQSNILLTWTLDVMFYLLLFLSVILLKSKLHWLFLQVSDMWHDMNHLKIFIKAKYFLCWFFYGKCLLCRFVIVQELDANFFAMVRQLLQKPCNLLIFLEYSGEYFSWRLWDSLCLPEHLQVQRWKQDFYLFFVFGCKLLSRDDLF